MCACANQSEVCVWPLCTCRVEVLEPLKALQQLRRLDVLACPLESVPDYDKKVFTMLPELEYLDNVDRQGNGEGLGQCASVQL